MTTELAKAKDCPTIQLYGQSLPQQQRSKHRAWIGVRIEALLDGYWQNLPSEPVKAEILGDWMAGLEAFSPDEITAACREWQQHNPRRKPNVGDIRAPILRNRAALVKPAPDAPRPDPVSPERAAEILAEVGFAPKKIGGAA